LEEARVVDGSGSEIRVAARMELQRPESLADLCERSLASLLERGGGRLGFVELLQARDTLREERRDRQRILPVGGRAAALVARRALSVAEELDRRAVSGEGRQRLVEGSLSGQEQGVVEELVEDDLRESDLVTLEQGRG